MWNNAVLVARVSTARQEKEGESLESQIQEMENYCSRVGLNPAYRFPIQESGLKNERPKMDAVKDLIRNGKIQHVIFTVEDRAGRNVAWLAPFIEFLAENSVRLHYARSGEANIKTAYGRAIQEMSAVMAKVGIMSQIEQGKRVQREMAEKGRIVGKGRAKYGYKIVGRKKDLRWEIDEDAANVVRMIFGWYAEGVGVSVIIDRLDSMGIPKAGGLEQYKHMKTKYYKWTKKGVYRILENGETYAGTHYQYTRSYRKDPVTGETNHVYKPKSEWLPVKVPAIISEEIYRIADARREIGKQLAPKNKKYEYLMAGRIKCLCGLGMTGKTTNAHYTSKRTGEVTNNKNAMYYCLTKHEKHHENCVHPSINVKVLDESVWKFVRQLLEKPEHIRILAEESQAEQRKEESKIQEEMERIGNAISRYESQYNNLLELYLDGRQPKEWLDQKSVEIQNSLTELNERYNALSGKLKLDALTDEDIADLENLCYKIKDMLEDADFPTKRELVNALDLRARFGAEDGEKVLYIDWYVHTWRTNLSGDFHYQK